MWLVLAYPPLVVPLSVERPSTCPVCGAKAPPSIHERLTRPLPGIARERDEHAKWLVTHYGTVRFRCRQCRATFTPPLPGWLPDSYLPQYIAARMVAWYGLGATPGMIATKLEDDGWAVGQATLYRTLDTAEATMAGLHDLHHAHRNRVRRGKQRGRRPRRMFDGTIELTGNKVFNVAHVDVRDPDAPQPTLFAVARFTVDLFALYGDALTRETVVWLDRYLRSLDHATVQAYSSWDHLEGAFTRGERLAHYEPGATLEMTGAELAQPPTPASPLLRRAVGVALRTAEVNRARWHQAAKRERAWANRSDGLLIVEIGEDELFDRL